MPSIRVAGCTRWRPAEWNRRGARLGGAMIYRMLRDIVDGFWNGIDYIWFCRWIP